MIALLIGLAAAHPGAPSLLTAVERADGVEIALTVPRTARSTPRAVLPCDGAVEPPVVAERTITTRWRLTCAGLAGRTLAAEGVGDEPVLVEATTAAGTERALLTADQPAWTVPAAATASGAALVRVGATHLLGGLDHVLLVLGLVLLLRGWRLVHAITAFTVGHAASLAAATLGLVAVPVTVVETGIAGTLVLLAAEAAGGSAGPFTRRPWLVGVPVGLLHGLGFAGGLADLGLGDGVLAGLLAFNVGLEIAQLAVAGAGLALLPWVARVPRARAAVAWAAGIVAGAWMVERALGL